MGTTTRAPGVLLLAPIVLFAVLSSSLAAAEEVVSLPRVIEYSLQHNGDLASFRQEKGVREAGRVRAGRLPNPTLDIEGATGAITGSSEENSLALGISQEIPLAGKRAKRLTIAERELEIYRWQLADRERLLREAVKTAFHDAVLAKERVTLAGRAIELNRQLLDVARERLAAGDIPELEMNLVKVELARSEGARIEAVKAMEQSRTKLWDIMGLSPGAEPAIAATFGTEPDVPQPLDELKRLARDNRPDLGTLKAEKSRDEAGIVLARAEGVPDLTAGVVFRRDTTTMEIGGVEGKDTAYTIGVNLSLPLPIFDRNQAGVQEAGARKSGSEARLAAAARRVEREVESAWFGYRNAVDVLSLYRSDIIPQLEENLQLSREAYRLGEVGVLEVIQEQKKFFEVNEGYLAARHDRMTAYVKLEAAVATEFSGGAQ